MHEGKMKKSIIGGCIVVLVVIGYVYARRTSTLFNLLLPPSDMFISLATKEADLTKTGIVQLPFQPKYPGSHELDLEVEKFDFGKPFKGKILLDIIVKNQKGEAIISKKINEPASSFLGTEKKGFVLQSFVVPDIISLGEKGTVEISVITPDSEFFGTYGNAKFAVNKGGDK
jgi:hypothetical protein